MSRLTRDGTAEPVSRDQILRHARGQGNIHFPCSADHEQDWQPYPVDPYSAICDDHTYIHTYTIGSVPSLSGHAVAYRWRSLPRVRWHRASSPQGSSSNGCCPCITMDQMLLCSSLFPHPLLIYSENVQIIGCTKYTSIKILVLLL